MQHHLDDKDASFVTQSHRIFFKSWANIWKENARVDKIINQVTTDPHAPTPFRGNMVKHIDCFYDAFGVAEGDAMYLPSEQRVKMW